MVYIRNGESEFEVGASTKFEHMPPANQDIPPFSVLPGEDGTYRPVDVVNLLLEMDRLSEMYEQSTPLDTVTAVMTEAHRRSAHYIPYSFEKLVGIIACPKVVLDHDPAEFFAVTQIIIERISTAKTNVADSEDETDET